MAKTFNIAADCKPDEHVGLDKLNNYYRSDKFYKRVLQEYPELAKQLYEVN